MISGVVIIIIGRKKEQKGSFHIKARRRTTVHTKSKAIFIYDYDYYYEYYVKKIEDS
jgi:hypothetical protein